MSPEPLVVVGAGGFGRETLELVRALNAVHGSAHGRDRWHLVGVFDDDRDLWGSRVDGVPVLGPVDAVAEHGGARVVVCTGSPRDYSVKQAIVGRLAGWGVAGGAFATLVHPGAVVPPSSCLGEGTVVLAGVVATTAVHVGAHVALMPQVVLTHDDALGDFVTVGAGARLAGGVAVDIGAYLGAGCLIREHVRIGAWSLVGMGAAVTRDVPAGQVWAGVPARFLRPVDLPREVRS